MPAVPLLSCSLAVESLTRAYVYGGSSPPPHSAGCQLTTAFSASSLPEIGRAVASIEQGDSMGLKSIGTTIRFGHACGPSGEVKTPRPSASSPSSCATVFRFSSRGSPRGTMTIQHCGTFVVPSGSG